VQRTHSHKTRSVLVTLLATAVLTAVAAPAAVAQTYPDVPKTQWAYAAIAWATDQGGAGGKLLDDYAGSVFKPDQAITRGQLAHALVIASGHAADVVTPKFIADVVPDITPYYWDIQIAVSLGLMSVSGDTFYPDKTAAAWQVDRSVIRMLMLMHPEVDWGMIGALNPKVWEPVAGWKTGAPSYLPYEVAARYLGLRYNHSSTTDAQELSPTDAMGRDEVAYVLWKALTADSWSLASLANYDNVRLPPLSDRQKQVITYAFKYVGYPYVWGGEWDTPNSPYGHQAHGGFDCSGFDWWVMKTRFGYPISLSQRTAAAMAGAAKPRITRSSLKPGDLIFFGPNGPRSGVSTIYHAGLYLGKGWFVHSTGSADGVSISSLNWNDYWKNTLAWGRRLLTKTELIVP
jgi:cell wall-associated NlpC family hydrolase